MNELPNEFNLPYPELMERIRYVESEMGLATDQKQFRELRAARSNMIVGIMRQQRWWENFDREQIAAEGRWFRRETRRSRAVAAVYAAHYDMPPAEYHQFKNWLLEAGEDGVAHFCDRLLNRLDGPA